MRGYVGACITFPIGNLEALFANATLERVNLELHNGEQKCNNILDPESSAPRLMLDGKGCVE